MKFHEKLEKLRAERDTPQAKVAREIGVDQAQVNKWFNGKAYPSATQMLRLARYFGVPAEYLIDDHIETLMPPLSEGDRLVLESFRESDLTASQAAKLLLTARSRMNTQRREPQVQ